MMLSTDFDPLPALVGGLLLGGAGSMLLLGQGRLAGISGILGGLLLPGDGERGWRLSFVLGLLSAGALAALVRPEAMAFTIERSTAELAGAGLLVGVGTALGSGCTSGHGVCGLSRFSVRSLVAVLTFMFTAGVVVALRG